MNFESDFIKIVNKLGGLPPEDFLMAISKVKSEMEDIQAQIDKIKELAKIKEERILKKKNTIVKSKTRELDTQMTLKPSLTMPVDEELMDRQAA